MKAAWRDKENERRRARYADDPTYREKRLRQGRQDSQTNRARCKAYYDRSEGTPYDPEKKRLANAKRKARQRGVYVEDVCALAVLERDDGVCGICGEDVDPTCFDVDHIVPIAGGGWHAYDNVQVAHPTCNRSKGSR